MKRKNLNKYLLFLFVFWVSLTSSQEKYIYYSDFVSKTTKKHDDVLLKFFKEVSKNKAIGIIKGYNIVLNDQIKVENLSNLNLKFQETTFLSTKRFLGAFFYFENCKNISIEGFKAVLSDGSFPVYKEKEYGQLFSGGLFFKACETIVLKYSTFENLYNRAVQIKESFGEITVSGNKFSSKKQNQSYMLEHLVIGSSPNAVIHIYENIFDNEKYTNPDFGICAISGYGLGKDGGSVMVRNNKINFAGRNNKGLHRLYAVDFYDDCNNITLKDNIFDNIIWGAIRFNGTSKNAIIENNKIHVTLADDTAVITSSTTNRNSELSTIHIINNSIDTDVPYVMGIMLQNNFSNIKTKDINVSKNKFNNCYVNAAFLGFFDDVMVSKNNFSGEKSATGILMQLEDVFKSSNLIKIDQNILEANNTGISLNARKGELFCKFLISDNMIFNETNSQKGFGIVLNLGVKGNVNITNNKISNFENALYLREKNYKVKHNGLSNNKINILK